MNTIHQHDNIRLLGGQKYFICKALLYSIMEVTIFMHQYPGWGSQFIGRQLKKVGGTARKIRISVARDTLSEEIQDIQ